MLNDSPLTRISSVLNDEGNVEKVLTGMMGHQFTILEENPKDKDENNSSNNNNNNNDSNKQ